MESRALGSASFSVSALGLGCNNLGRPGTATLDQAGTDAVIRAALDAGVTFFDTADIYGAEPGLSESRLGVALRGVRDEAIVASKFGHAEFSVGLDDRGPRGGRAYIRAAVEASLRRLQTDHIDLYQMHTPDPATPIEETLGALDELVREGKVREIGHSNFSAAEIRDAAAVAATRGTAAFVSAQNLYNLLEREVERDVLPAVAAEGLGFLPFFPLSNGLFSGKFSRDSMPADSRIARQRPHIHATAPWSAIEAFESFARARGLGLLEATLGWFLARPELSSVIAGATTPEQVRQNAAAAASWRPTVAELEQIDDFFAPPRPAAPVED